MMLEYSDSGAKLSFFNACETARAYTGGMGIGTLNEKQLHCAIKFFIEPDSACHEVRIGRNVADVRNEHGIFEVKTRAFNAMRKKLAGFLKIDAVTIVHPIPAQKRIFKLDEKSGELSAPRKSPKRGTAFDVFPELYKLSELINSPNFRLLILLINMDEYRLVGGRTGRKGYVRFDRLPVELVNAVYLTEPTDYLQLLPKELPQQFTTRDLSVSAHIPLPIAQTTLLVLKRLGAVSCTGKSGRLNLYNVETKTPEQ